MLPVLAVVPWVHKVQLVEPGLEAKVPIGHGVQLFAVSWVLEYVPGGQSVQPLAPCAENLPGGQLTQLVAFEPDEYLPAGHGVQAVEPAAGENFPGGHTAHVLILVAFVADEAVPATHCVQVVAPAPE